MAILLGLINGCAKEEAPEMVNEEIQEVSHMLKLASGPVSFGDMGTVELLSSEIVNKQSFFTYLFTPGITPATELLLGAKKCRDSDIIATISPGELSIGKVAYFKKYKQYKNIEWLKITGLPTEGSTEFILTMEGTWNSVEGTAMLKDGNNFETELMHVPECRTWDLPRVKTISVVPDDVNI